MSCEARAACRNPNVAVGNGLLLRPAAASGFVEIKWFGHAFFQITSSSGTRIITDPFGNMGYPMPEVWPDVVTVGREVGNHNNVGLAKGDPVVLRGIKSGGGEWNEISTIFRDVLIYNVPIHTRAPYQYIKGSAFVFELDGLCIWLSYLSSISDRWREGWFPWAISKKNLPFVDSTPGREYL